MYEVKVIMSPLFYRIAINNVKVVTGDRRGAGTDATVSIVLYGDGKNNSGPPKVLQNSQDNFERGI